MITNCFKTVNCYLRFCAILRHIFSRNMFKRMLAIANVESKWQNDIYRYLTADRCSQSRFGRRLGLMVEIDVQMLVQTRWMITQSIKWTLTITIVWLRNSFSLQILLKTSQSAVLAFFDQSKRFASPSKIKAGDMQKYWRRHRSVTTFISWNEKCDHEQSFLPFI